MASFEIEKRIEQFEEWGISTDSHFIFGGRTLSINFDTGSGSKTINFENREILELLYDIIALLCNSQGNDFRTKKEQEALINFANTAKLLYECPPDEFKRIP